MSEEREKRPALIPQTPEQIIAERWEMFAEMKRRIRALEEGLGSIRQKLEQGEEASELGESVDGTSYGSTHEILSGQEALGFGESVDGTASDGNPDTNGLGPAADVTFWTNPETFNSGD